MIKARITVVSCDSCGEQETHYQIEEKCKNKSKMDGQTKLYLREKNWVITREGKMFCPVCAKKLKLRNSGVSKK